MEEIKKIELLKIILDQREKARHWRFCHYDSARYYKKIDSLLGLPSVILSTIILGFAFFSVGRNVSLCSQILLASLTVIQGILLTVQLYLKPSFLSESHRNSAEKLGTLGRKWASAETKLKIDEKAISIEIIDELMQSQDAITRESEPIPKWIIKKYGLRTSKNEEKI